MICIHEAINIGRGFSYSETIQICSCLHACDPCQMNFVRFHFKWMHTRITLIRKSSILVKILSHIVCVFGFGLDGCMNLWLYVYVCVVQNCFCMERLILWSLSSMRVDVIECACHVCNLGEYFNSSNVGRKKSNTVETSTVIPIPEIVLKSIHSYVAMCSRIIQIQKNCF